ncbi:glycosyltransferase [Salarchaeum sp. III]|uniref:glycosyltransferase n=1 Tax=Salarchaeum sp. III TaxID=3107927 RepID=UPI002EDA8A58
MQEGIALFVYNRPQHLNRVLKKLKENDINQLYIFADGPKAEEGEEDLRDIEKVRTQIDAIDWCETTIIKRDENVGLAKSIITGVDRVFEDYDRIIVLEDDCMPSKNYISYMRKMLDKYENNGRVMNVNGYSPPIRIPDSYDPDIYFTYRNSSWGWGTWKSAWENYVFEPFDLDELESNREELIKVTRKAGHDLYPMMKEHLEGEINSWAVWWSYAIAKEGGLCVNPIKSHIQNIGHDDSGTHTTSTEKFEVDLSPKPVTELDLPDNPFIESTINRRYNRAIAGGRLVETKLKILNKIRSI